MVQGALARLPTWAHSMFVGDYSAGALIAPAEHFGKCVCGRDPDPCCATRAADLWSTPLTLQAVPPHGKLNSYGCDTTATHVNDSSTRSHP